MYTVPIKLWVDKLLSKCARTDMTNTFLMPQTMSNSLTLQNNSLDLNEVPTQSHSGATHEIAFTDSHSRPLGKLQAIRTNTDATGVQLEVNGNTLGLQVSDEGIPTSFVNHPYPDGPANQIATMKYVADWGKYLEEYLYQVKTLLDQTRADIQTIQESVELLNLLRHIDDVPTEGSNNLVKSGGIYSFVISRLGTGLNDLRTELNGLREELLNAIRNSSADLIASNSGVGQFKVGMIRSCFCIYGGNILPGDLISGSRLIYGNHKFQVEDDDKQWSLCSYFGEHRTFCELGQAISNGWTLPSNTTWVALAPCYGQDYGSTHGLFMCVEVR